MWGYVVRRQRDAGSIPGRFSSSACTVRRMTRDLNLVLATTLEPRRFFRDLAQQAELFLLAPTWIGLNLGYEGMNFL
jgi:hypothetical protein